MDRVYYDQLKKHGGPVILNPTRGEMMAGLQYLADMLNALGRHPSAPKWALRKLEYTPEMARRDAEKVAEFESAWAEFIGGHPDATEDAMCAAYDDLPGHVRATIMELPMRDRLEYTYRLIGVTGGAR